MNSVIRKLSVICDSEEIIAGYLNTFPCMFIALLKS